MHQDPEMAATLAATPDDVTLADLAQIGDSPMLRAMGSEVVDVNVHDGLAAIARYEEGLD
jgi:hypothetical protein